MSEVPIPTSAERRMRQERDPYPKMILVCMGIALVLVTIIFGFIFFDFMSRSESSVRPVRPTSTQPIDAPASE